MAARIVRRVALLVATQPVDAALLLGALVCLALLAGAAS